MKTGIIYKGFNKITKQVYINMSYSTMKDAISKDYKNRKSYDSYIYNALDLYDREDFEWTIIDSAVPLERIDEFLLHYIKKYDAFYNKNKGKGDYTIFMFDRYNLIEVNREHILKDQMLLDINNNYYMLLNSKTNVGVTCNYIYFKDSKVNLLRTAIPRHHFKGNISDFLALQYKHFPIKFKDFFLGKIDVYNTFSNYESFLPKTPKKTVYKKRKKYVLSKKRKKYNLHKKRKKYTITKKIRKKYVINSKRVALYKRAYIKNMSHDEYIKGLEFRLLEIRDYDEILMHIKDGKSGSFFTKSYKLSAELYRYLRYKMGIKNPEILTERNNLIKSNTEYNKILQMYFTTYDEYIKLKAELENTI